MCCLQNVYCFQQFVSSKTFFSASWLRPCRSIPLTPPLPSLRCPSPSLHRDHTPCIELFSFSMLMSSSVSRIAFFHSSRTRCRDNRLPSPSSSSPPPRAVAPPPGGLRGDPEGGITTDTTPTPSHRLLHWDNVIINWWNADNNIGRFHRYQFIQYGVLNCLFLG